MAYQYLKSSSLQQAKFAASALLVSVCLMGFSMHTYAEEDEPISIADLLNNQGVPQKLGDVLNVVCGTDGDSSACDLFVHKTQYIDHDRLFIGFDQSAANILDFTGVGELLGIENPPHIDLFSAKCLDDGGSEKNCFNNNGSFNRDTILDTNSNLVSIRRQGMDLIVSEDDTIKFYQTSTHLDSHPYTTHLISDDCSTNPSAAECTREFDFSNGTPSEVSKLFVYAVADVEGTAKNLILNSCTKSVSVQAMLETEFEDLVDDIENEALSDNQYTYDCNVHEELLTLFAFEDASRDELAQIHAAQLQLTLNHMATSIVATEGLSIISGALEGGSAAKALVDGSNGLIRFTLAVQNAVTLFESGENLINCSDAECYAVNGAEFLLSAYFMRQDIGEFRKAWLPENVRNSSNPTVQQFLDEEIEPLLQDVEDTRSDTRRARPGQEYDNGDTAQPNQPARPGTPPAIEAGPDVDIDTHFPEGGITIDQLSEPNQIEALNDSRYVNQSRGTGRAIAGHGRLPEQGATFRVPEGTIFVTWGVDGLPITDSVGVLIERGETAELLRRGYTRKIYLPGDYAPDYRVSRGDGLTIQPNSYRVTDARGIAVSEFIETREVELFADPQDVAHWPSSNGYRVYEYAACHCDSLGRTPLEGGNRSQILESQSRFSDYLQLLENAVSEIDSKISDGVFIDNAIFEDMVDNYNRFINRFHTFIGETINIQALDGNTSDRNQDLTRRGHSLYAALQNLADQKLTWRVYANSLITPRVVDQFHRSLRDHDDSEIIEITDAVSMYLTPLNEAVELVELHNDTCLSLFPFSEALEDSYLCLHAEDAEVHNDLSLDFISANGSCGSDQHEVLVVNSADNFSGKFCFGLPYDGLISWGPEFGNANAFLQMAGERGLNFHEKFELPNIWDLILPIPGTCNGCPNDVFLGDQISG